MVNIKREMNSFELSLTSIKTGLCVLLEYKVDEEIKLEYRLSMYSETITLSEEIP